MWFCRLQCSSLLFGTFSMKKHGLELKTLSFNLIVYNLQVVGCNVVVRFCYYC